jgi:pilus assembly protein CpaB
MPEPTSRKRILAFSALSALAGVALLRVYMHRFEIEASGGPRTHVLVFTRDAEAGERLDRETLGTRAVPEAYLESRHVAASALDDVVGTRLAVAGRAHEAVLWTDLASMRRPDRHLSSLVAEGMRAIRVDLRAGSFDELLRPGDRVDVLITRERGPAEGTSTLPWIENLLVLAVGGDTGTTDDARARRASGRVTLSATLEQARLLTQGEREGELRLVLRNPEDALLTGTTAGERREAIAASTPQDESGAPPRTGGPDAP